MALEVVWTNEAAKQLVEVIEYLEENWTETEISNFFTRLEESINSICNNPDTYKNSLRKKGTKEFQLSKKTTIFYSFDDQVVNVLLLWPNKDNPDGLERMKLH